MWMAFSMLSSRKPNWALCNKAGKVTVSKTAPFCIQISPAWGGMISGPNRYGQCNFLRGRKPSSEKNVSGVISHANVKTGETILEIVSIFSTLSEGRQSLRSDAISMNLINWHSYPQSLSHLLCVYNRWFKRVWNRFWRLFARAED